VIALDGVVENGNLRFEAVLAVSDSKLDELSSSDVGITTLWV
jgi:hypothetical protein